MHSFCNRLLGHHFLYIYLFLCTLLLLQYWKYSAAMQPCVLRDVKRKMNAWKNSLKCTCASDAFLDLLFCFFDVFQFILYWYRYSVSTLSWRMTRRRAVLMCNTRRVQVMTDGEVMFYFNGFLRVARHTFHSIHQNRENVRMWNAKYDARSSSSIKTYDICACSTHWIAWLYFLNCKNC